MNKHFVVQNLKMVKERLNLLLRKLSSSKEKCLSSFNSRFSFILETVKPLLSQQIVTQLYFQRR